MFRGTLQDEDLSGLELDIARRRRSLSYEQNKLLEQFMGKLENKFGRDGLHKAFRSFDR